MCLTCQAAAPVGQVLLRRDSHCTGCFGGHPAIFCCCEVLIVGPFFQESSAYLEAIDHGVVWLLIGGSSLEVIFRKAQAQLRVPAPESSK
jgi:hypothetical protein